MAVVPGDAFGPGGAGHVRCAYAIGLTQIEQAIERIDRFLHTQQALEHAGARTSAG